MTEACGPYCHAAGDFGADVIKWSGRNRDQSELGPIRGERIRVLSAANRNKRSISLNYDNPRGRCIAETSRSADVFITNQPSLLR